MSKVQSGPEICICALWSLSFWTREPNIYLCLEKKSRPKLLPPCNRQWFPTYKLDFVRLMHSQELWPPSNVNIPAYWNDPGTRCVPLRDPLDYYLFTWLQGSTLHLFHFWNEWAGHFVYVENLCLFVVCRETLVERWGHKDLRESLVSLEVDIWCVLWRL